MWVLEGCHSVLLSRHRTVWRQAEFLWMQRLRHREQVSGQWPSRCGEPVDSGSALKVELRGCPADRWDFFLQRPGSHKPISGL